MSLLALDTSTTRASVALRRGDGLRLSAPIDAPASRHGRNLVPALRNLLAEAGVGAADLSAIGVGLGPGSYTGLRVGVTAAKVLAYATGARLIGLDSLEFFARSAPETDLRVVALSDAQRGDFHVGDFARDAPGSPLKHLGPTRIAAAGKVFRDLPCVAVGPGLERWAGPWPEGVTPVPVETPDATILLDLLDDALASGRADDPWFLEPIYLRRSAAEDQWDAKGQTP